MRAPTCHADHDMRGLTWRSGRWTFRRWDGRTGEMRYCEQDGTPWPAALWRRALWRCEAALRGLRWLMRVLWRGPYLLVLLAALVAAVLAR